VEMEIEMFPERESLYVPDRFEGLKDAPEGALRTIVTPVHRTLGQLDELAGQMRASRRGALMLLRGDGGWKDDVSRHYLALS
jgi:hypothetical protein